MDVQVAVLADYANVAAGDKLNVMGIFDTVFAPTLPTVHPALPRRTLSRQPRAGMWTFAIILNIRTLTW
jgi:uncharacterized protein DUF6941